MAVSKSKQRATGKATPGRKPRAQSSRKAPEVYGTEEELNAFLDQLLERGDRMLVEFKELSARIRRGL